MRPNFPQITPSYEELPEDADERREALIEMFGQHCLWSRNLVLRKLKTWLSSPELRKSLDSTRRNVLDEVSRMPEDDQQKALVLTQLGMDVFLEHILALLGNLGCDLTLPSHYAVRYKLQIEICDVDSGNAVEKCVINRDQKGFYPRYLEGWLQRYADI